MCAATYRSVLEMYAQKGSNKSTSLQKKLNEHFRNPSQTTKHDLKRVAALLENEIIIHKHDRLCCFFVAQPHYWLSNIGMWPLPNNCSVTATRKTKRRSNQRGAIAKIFKVVIFVMFLSEKKLRSSEGSFCVGVRCGKKRQATKTTE